MPNRRILTVTGMICDGCVASATRVLSRVPGVNDVDVNLAQGRASWAETPAWTRWSTPYARPASPGQHSNADRATNR